MPSIQPVMKSIESFRITGCKTRTRNSEEFNAETAKIPGLWQQFFASSLMDKGPVFAVYSDYESDEKGEYTVTAGIIRDESGKDFDSLEINAGHYLVFQGKGTMPLAVIEAWKAVWDYFNEESPYQRCFTTDFEAYGEADEVAIYIAVKQPS